jgi:hypothetical protein
MIIDGMELPSIGFIRVKPPRKELGERLFTLIIWPPGPGPLAGADGATELELYVEADEVKRICSVAPHLISAAKWPSDVWDQAFGELG